MTRWIFIFLSLSVGACKEREEIVNNRTGNPFGIEQAIVPSNDANPPSEFEIEEKTGGIPIEGYPADFFTLSFQQGDIGPLGLIPGFTPDSSPYLVDATGKSWLIDEDGSVLRSGVFVSDESSLETYAFNDKLLWRVSEVGVSRFIKAAADQTPLVVTLPYAGPNEPILSNPSLKTIGVAEEYLLRSSESEVHLYHYADEKINVRVIQLPEGFTSDNRPTSGGSLEGEGFWFGGSAGILLLVPSEIEGQDKWAKNTSDTPFPRILFARFQRLENNELSALGPVFIEEESLIKSSVNIEILPAVESLIAGNFAQLVEIHCLECHAEATKKNWWLARRTDANNRIGNASMPPPENSAITPAEREEMIRLILAL